MTSRKPVGGPVPPLPGMVSNAQESLDAVAEDEMGEEDEWEDDEGDGVGADGGLAGLDPEMLKAVLKQRLADAGLQGVDEEAFMASLSKMLAGEEGCWSCLPYPS